MTGTWDNLTADEERAITTGTIQRTQDYGDLKIIFNRGLLSTQAFAKRKGGVEGVDDRASAREILEDPNNIWRKRLSGQMLYNINQFFKRAKAEGGGMYYAALYELTDKKLIEELCSVSNIEIILSNANSSEQEKGADGKTKTISINDGTNSDTRIALRKLADDGKLKLYDRMLGTHIGHNKFVIYADKNGRPKAVLTGSTNWTATGLCGQTNNMVFIESNEIADRYLDYWNQLKADVKQAAALRTWCCAKGETYSLQPKTKTDIWYSPNTKQKSKPKDAETPVDMQEVYSLIESAKHSVLFLVFNPGAPSILEKIQEVAEQRQQEGKQPLFVRGAISDAKIAARVRTDIFSRSILQAPDRYTVTGVAAIPGPFSYFEQELLKLGYATIHDKIMVVDPFEKACAVVTGSHNLGYKASYTNDENMLIIRNNAEVAQAYAAHVLDVVNHFKWRYKLQQKIAKAGAKTLAQKKKVLDKEWNDLDEHDTWMDYYFGPNGFKSADRLFLPK